MIVNILCQDFGRPPLPNSMMTCAFVKVVCGSESPTAIAPIKIEISKPQAMGILSTLKVTSRLINRITTIIANDAIESNFSHTFLVNSFRFMPHPFFT